MMYGTVVPLTSHDLGERLNVPGGQQEEPLPTNRLSKKYPNRFIYAHDT